MESVWLVGIAFYPKLAQMVQPMMTMAQSDQVLGVRFAAVLPVADVMDLEPAAAVTPWHPTPPVALLDHDPCAAGHGPEGPTDADRLAAGFQYRPDASVASGRYWRPAARR